MTIFNEVTAHCIGVAQGEISRLNSELTDLLHCCISGQEFDCDDVMEMEDGIKGIEKNLCYLRLVVNRMKVIADQRRLLSEKDISNSQQKAMKKIEEETDEG